MTDAREALKKDRPNLERAIDALDEGTGFLSSRAKMIQFVDSNPAGWSAVEEYERKALADDSDDDKRMMKAEATATRKLIERKASKQRGRGAFHGLVAEGTSSPFLGGGH